MRLARSSGSAHRGLGEWLWQRFTAIYLGGYVLAIGLWWLLAPPTDYNAWRELLSSPTWRIATSLFYAAVLVHAWIGMRSVYLDYLKPLWLRFTVASLTGAGLLVLALWAGEVLLWGLRN